MGGVDKSEAEKTMISRQAQEIRAGLEKEVVDTSITLEDERNGWEESAKTQSIADGIVVQDRDLNGVRCLFISPENTIHNCTMLYAHGGGLVAGSAATHRQFGSYLARAMNCRVVMLDYGLIPENAFDKPREDVITAYQCLISEFRFQPDRIIFAGDSSGAGVALAAMVKLRDLGVILPKAFVSISGAFDMSLSGKTIKNLNALDPILSRNVLRHWQETYFTGKIGLDAPEISPLFSSLMDLPPMLLIVGTDEVWLSDTNRLVEKVQLAGGVAQAEIFDQMWHCFPMHVDMPEAQEAMKMIVSFVDL